MRQKDLSATEFSFAEEFRDLDLNDERLNQRFIRVVDAMAAMPSAPINKACGTWAETKGAYRLFSNEKLLASEVIEAHRKQTIERMKARKRVLIIQDTTSFNYQTHFQTKELGLVGSGGGKKKENHGLYAHTTLAVSMEGTPLGVIEQKCWARGHVPDEEDEFSVCHKEAKKWFSGLRSAHEAAAQSGVEIITVADREADITDLIAYANRNKSGFVIRSKSGRGVGLADRLIYQMSRLPVMGEVETLLHKNEDEGWSSGQTWTRKKVRGKKQLVHLEIRFASVTLNKGQRMEVVKKPKPEELMVNVVFVTEKAGSLGKKDLSWMLLTSLEVSSLEQAIEVVEIYKKRWLIEVYHKILKSGCQIENCRLSDGKRLIRFITIMSVVAWRLHLLTRAARETPDVECTKILTEQEWKVLYLKATRKKTLPAQTPTLKMATQWIANLGGHLGRKCDGPPGVIVMWRGWQALKQMTDIYDVIDELKRCG